MAPKTVGVDRLSDLLDISPRRIQQLVKEGMPKAAKRGAYDEEKCVRWYVRYLQKAIEGRGVANGDGAIVFAREEKTRSLKADAELKEIILAEKRRELVAVSDVRKTFGDLIVQTKARILSTPPAIANAVVGMEQRTMIQATTEKILRDALKLLADDGSKYTLPG